MEELTIVTKCRKSVAQSATALFFFYKCVQYWSMPIPQSVFQEIYYLGSRMLDLQPAASGNSPVSVQHFKPSQQLYAVFVSRAALPTSQRWRDVLHVFRLTWIYIRFVNLLVCWTRGLFRLSSLCHISWRLRCRLTPLALGRQIFISPYNQSTTCVVARSKWRRLYCIPCVWQILQAYCW